MTPKHKVLLGKPEHVMTMDEFLAYGFKLEDIPSRFLVGLAPHGESGPVEVVNEAPAVNTLGNFYEVKLKDCGLVSPYGWVLVGANGGPTIGVETRHYGVSDLEWSILIARAYHVDYMPVSELGLDGMRKVLADIGAYRDINVYVGQNVDNLIERKLSYDFDARDNKFCRVTDYHGGMLGIGLLADAMVNDEAFSTLAPLIWLDADTIKKYAPGFYHTQAPVLNIGDYALTVTSRIIKVTAIEADAIRAVPVRGSGGDLVLTHTSQDGLIKLDGELVKQLLNSLNTSESGIM